MRVMRWIARSAGAALVGFHAWLFVSQWADGRLQADPALILRWAAALGLASALIWLGREGTSLVSRQAIVVWLLAALLHGPAVAAKTADLQTLPETVASLVVTTAVAGVLGVALWALWLIAGLFPRRNARRYAVRPVPQAAARLDDGFSTLVSARPPPLAHN